MQRVKSVPIRSFLWSVFSYIQSEYRKIESRKTSYLDPFHAVMIFCVKLFTSVFWKLIICGVPYVFYKEISWKHTYKLYILSKRPSDIIQYTYLISTISRRAGFIFQNSRPVLFPMYFAKLSMSMHAYFETTLGDCIRYSIQQRSSWNNSKILAVPLFYYSNRYLSSKTFSLPMHSRTSSCLSQQEKCKIYAFKVNNKYTKMKGLLKTLTIFTKCSIIDLEIARM